MTRLRHFCAVTVLTFILAISAFAGNMECGAVSPPPPEQTASVTGDIDCGVTATCGTTSVAFVDPVTELALDILGLLSLF